MLSHFTLGTNDIPRSIAFYTPVMATLNQVLIDSSEEYFFSMYGPAKTPDSDQHAHPHLFICKPFDNLPATWSNGFHIAFNAPSQSAVDAFHAAAVANGGYDDGAPGLRPHYNEDYYAAYVRDPDGNKLQAVCYLNGRKVGNTGDVVSHITIGVADFNRERAFYLALLNELGYVELTQESGDDDVAFGIDGYQLPTVYIQSTFDGRPATWGNGTHTALLAPDRASVDRFHATALAHGGTDEGAPALRTHYSENYYAAYVRDPVGNKLQAVYRGSGENSSSIIATNQS